MPPTDKRHAHTSTSSQRPRRSGDIPSTTRLAALYEDLNRTLFEGRLPPYRLQFRPFERGDQVGYYNRETRTIELATSLQPDPEQLRQALLHEMCHIGSPGHGRRFQEKLSRLAAKGESWAEDQRRQYADRPHTSLTAEIAQEIDDRARDVPHVKWSRRVLEALAEGWTCPGLVDTRVKLPMRRVRADARTFGG
jgi:hypothetical protein